MEDYQYSSSFDVVAMPLMRLLRFAYGALSLIIGEYSSIFEDTQENRQIDARMRRARHEA